MIDFRYHLVSIVSIFLALAVGIVLGAGPLQGQIAETLTSEITQLRADKQSLRSEVTSLGQELSVRDGFDKAVLDRVVAGVISGRGVAIVELPGADADLLRTINGAVVAAGGTVTSTTRMLDAWVATDPKISTARTDLANRLASTLRVTPSPAGAPGPSTADKVLAAALTSSPSGGGAGPEASRAALAELVGAQLIEVDAPTVTPAQLVVVVSDPIGAKNATATAQAGAWTQLALALDTAAVGCVLAAPDSAATTDQQTSVLRTLRLDAAAAKAVSTVDDAATGMGVVSIVLGLVQQEAGAAGHFGTDEGSTAPYAPLPTP